jgi:hypothetical protein
MKIKSASSIAIVYREKKRERERERVMWFDYYSCSVCEWMGNEMEVWVGDESDESCEANRRSGVLSSNTHATPPFVCLPTLTGPGLSSPSSSFIYQISFHHPTNFFRILRLFYFILYFHYLNSRYYKKWQVFKKISSVRYLSSGPDIIKNNFDRVLLECICYLNG